MSIAMETTTYDRPTRLCVVSFKECWQDEQGQWMSYGGFPAQMAGIGSLFDDMTLIIVQGKPRSGGIPLPRHATIVSLRSPTGEDTRRKISVLANIPYYINMIVRYARQADVVHTPLPGDIPLLGMWVALLLRKRLIVRYGGSWVANTQTTMMNRVTRWSIRTFAGGRNVMLATGEGTAPPAPRMHWVFSTVLSGTVLQQIQPVLDRGLSTPPRLIYAGRLSPEKGVAHLVEAIAQLKANGSGPLPQVLIAGDGPQRKELEKLVQERGCETHFVFAGQLTYQQLSAQFNQADICVQPSLTEGFSKAWLDAMAHGVPVVASEVGAARSVIGGQGNRGWLVQPGDNAGLAQTLQWLLTTPLDWPTLRRRCRGYVENRTLEAWSWRIGEICGQQWQTPLVNGKIHV
jgi:glycosyltransferase involved in cell wall biosynthesis